MRGERRKRFIVFPFLCGKRQPFRGRPNVHACGGKTSEGPEKVPRMRATIPRRPAPRQLGGSLRSSRDASRALDASVPRAASARAQDAPSLDVPHAVRGEPHGRQEVGSQEQEACRWGHERCVLAPRRADRARSRAHMCAIVAAPCARAQPARGIHERSTDGTSRGPRLTDRMPLMKTARGGCVAVMAVRAPARRRNPLFGGRHGKRAEPPRVLRSLSEKPARAMRRVQLRGGTRWQAARGVVARRCACGRGRRTAADGP